jgi:hypothetical protein
MKKFKEIRNIVESKFVSEDPYNYKKASSGVHYEVKKSTNQFGREIHDVYHNGEKIGHVKQSEVTPHKKIPGTRFIRHLKPRKEWSFHLDYQHVRPGDILRHHQTNGHSSKKAALQALADHHKANPNLNEETLIEAKRKKYLGQYRGKTATGDKANVIDTKPTLKYRRKSARK